FLIVLRRSTPLAPLFPYTTLFRSSSPPPLRASRVETIKNGNKDSSSGPPQRASPSRRARAQAAGAAKGSAAVSSASRTKTQRRYISSPPASIYMDRSGVPCRRQHRPAAPPTGGEKVSKQRKGRLTPRGWLRLLFGQPPAGMYRRPAVYMTGSQMEIEHFKTI